MFHPASILLTWLFGLLSFALPIAGGYLIWNWYEQSHVRVQVISTAATQQAGQSEPLYIRKFAPDFGANSATGLLALGAFLCLGAAGGGRLLLRLLLPRQAHEGTSPPPSRVDHIQRPDGTEIEFETTGQSTGPTIVLTHGLGMDRKVWHKIVKQFASRYQIVIWDLPGMGRSKKGRKPYTVARLADDLAAVLRRATDKAGGAPVVAVGHSLGGMLLRISSAFSWPRVRHHEPERHDRYDDDRGRSR